MERQGVSIPAQEKPAEKVFYIHAAGFCLACTNPDNIKGWVDYLRDCGYAAIVTTNDECLSPAS